MNNNMSAIETLLNKPADEQVKAGYADTAREIASQSGLWLETLTLADNAMAGLSDFLGKDPVILLSGAGSSHYVSLSVQPALKRVYSQVDAIPSTEILMDPESSFPRKPFVLVSFARSGNSPEGNAVASLAEELRPGLVRQIAITCNKDGGLASIVGSLGNRGKVILLPEASNDRSLAMTSSFSCMVVAGLSLAFLDRRPAYATLVHGLASSAKTLINTASDLASELSREGYKRVFFLASRPFLGGAYEGHLKIQELTGGAVLAKAEDTLGFRHGFMAAVDKDSLVVLFRSNDGDRRLYEDDLLREMTGKKLGKRIVVVSDSGSESDSSVTALACGSISDDDGRALVPALFGQLLGIFTSMACGLKPDNPSPSGVINRVVQGVYIHPRQASVQGSGK